MKQISFYYDIGDTVKIVPLNTEGHVIGLFYGETGPQFQTSYFYEGEKRITYLFGYDLEPANGSKPLKDIGFQDGKKSD